MTEDRTKQLVAAHMDQARQRLDTFLDTHGISLAVLGVAMEEFTKTVFDLPDGTVCKAGCAYCCCLKVGVSIPELLVIFNGLKAQTTKEGLGFFRDRVLATAARGNTLEDEFWRTTRTPCPFLDPQGQCLIYALRPFSCRAYHSTDMSVCQDGHDRGCEIQVPCYPLFRTCTDMYSSVFIKVMADRGFASFQVGFVKGLEILFQDQSAQDRWLNHEDVFAPARLG